MKKKLNTSGILNELRGESSYFRPNDQEGAVEESGGSTDRGAQSSPAPTGGTSSPATTQPTDGSASRPIDPSTRQSTAQSTGASTRQTTDEPRGASFDHSAILGRPKAFYITQQQDTDLDQAVNRLTERVAGQVEQKIDRSTIVRLLLEEADLTSSATIEHLHKQLVSRLISQLTGQSTG